VLIDERQPLEAQARDGDLKVVAAACPVDDGKLRRIGKCLLKKELQRLGRHRGIVASALDFSATEC
jgi:hypothetical protein